MTLAKDCREDFASSVVTATDTDDDSTSRATRSSRDRSRDATPKRAVVLAGGVGARLRPYTAVIPKPLMPVGDRPILDIVMRQLRRHGFEQVTVATGHLAQLIETFFGDGSNYGMKIDYYREDEALGTVGALALIDELDVPFLVMNGDILTDLDYDEILTKHLDGGAAATIAVTTKTIQVSLGVMHFGDERDADRVTDYVEKPTLDYEASMGVYCFSPRAIRYIRPGERLDFPDLVLRLLRAGEVVNAWRPDAYWLDIGRHDDYEQAMEEFERMRPRLLPDDTEALRR
ncbi:sugar phosphate nucleotidyltransferase [Actinomycetospora succinea]|uniref:sugar phosphate nucleotidyltransferase n=1 Tax=Actinomycetospora succinea TaxID=663603 RepID=UPI001AAC874A|nr:sugar phosphate nucleotidyltransferase [Actinomycetospora succinea]